MEERNTTEKMRVMPASAEAEQAVLGAIILDNEVALRWVSELTEEDFYSASHRVIFREIRTLTAKNQPVDIVMLANALEREEKLAAVGGVTMLVSLTESIPSTSNVGYYVAILKRTALLRGIIRRCNDIIANAYAEEDAEKVLAVAESLILNINDKKDAGGLTHVSETAVEVINKLAEIYNTGGETAEGLLTGFSNLDEKTHGFRGGQLIVVAARPGCGKTSFALGAAANIACGDKQKVVALFNLEMSAQELVQRLLANLSGIDSEIMMTGEQQPGDLDKMWKAAALLGESNLYIDDAALISAEQIMSKCRRLKNQKGRLDLVIVDYLQLMECSPNDRGASKQQQVSNTSRAMKILAKELDVPVVLLSQMSRNIEQRDDKTPKLSDLRESGAIEQDADIVMFLTEGDFEVFDAACAPIYLMIAKHRNGSVCDLAFKWNKGKMVFTPVRNIVKKSEEERKPDKPAGDGAAPPPEAPPAEPEAPADIPDDTAVPPEDPVFDFASLASGLSMEPRVEEE